MSYTSAAHEPKHELGRGIYTDEKILLFATLLQNVTATFLARLRSVAEKQVESLRLSVSSKQGFHLLQQYMTAGLDHIQNWSENELKDEEARVMQMFSELPDLYSYAAVAMAQSFVQDVTAEIKLELPGFRSFLFCYYQTLAAQPYIRSLNYFDNWHLETTALIQDVVRYSLYSMVKGNLKYEGRGRSSSVVTTKDIVRFKQDPVQALEQIGVPDMDQIDSVSQVGEPAENRFFEPPATAPAPAPDTGSHVSSRHSHVSHRSNASHASRHSKAGSHTSHRSSASRRSILDDARSILSKARSRASVKSSRHDDGTYSVVSNTRDNKPDTAGTADNRSDKRSDIRSLISLNLSDAQLMTLDEDRSSFAAKKKTKKKKDVDSDTSSSSSGSSSSSASPPARRSNRSSTSSSVASSSHYSRASSRSSAVSRSTQL